MHLSSRAKIVEELDEAILGPVAVFAVRGSEPLARNHCPPRVEDLPTSLTGARAQAQIRGKGKMKVRRSAAFEARGVSLMFQREVEREVG